MGTKKCIDNYYRVATLSADDIKCVLRGRGWVSMTQLVGMLHKKVAPENAVRFYRYYINHTRGGRKPRRGTSQPIAVQILRGKRQVIQRRIYSLVRSRSVEHRIGSKSAQAWYRLIEDMEDSSNGKHESNRPG